jgi:two-component system cell cycle response regulator DivK
MARPAKILVVDDYADGREMIAEYLEFKGFLVQMADSGAEAIDVARRDKPDIILMDLQMPGIDGWEATRRLKRDPATKHIFIFAVTAHAFKKEEAAARDAGCDSVIAKPFDLAVLAQALHKVLKHGAHMLDPGAVNLKESRKTTRRSRLSKA